MSNYTKATNFTAKDSLPTGNSGKIVKGTEIDTELTAIASAISSKADSNSPTFTGTPLAPTASSGTNNTQLATTAFVTTAVAAATGSLGTLSSQDSDDVAITGGVINGTTIGGTTAAAVTGTTITATTAFVGDLTGDVTGNVTGNVTGDVTGDLTGNADTATAFSTTSGSAPVYAVRAWCMFDGTSASPTVIAGGNVSSISKTGTGQYTITFSTALPSSNYVTMGTVNSGSNGYVTRINSSHTTTTAYVGTARTDSDGYNNYSLVTVAFLC